MNQTVLKSIVLISILALCIPLVAAAGNFSDSSKNNLILNSQKMPNSSSFELTNGGSICQYCPIWDGDHTKPDPFLVYELRKKIVADSLKVQGKTTLQNQDGVLSLQPPLTWRGMPTKGTVKIPVFLVDFSDAPHYSSQTVTDIQSKMFGNGDINDFPYESLKNYYQRSSYNQLNISGDVYGWYRAT